MCHVREVTCVWTWRITCEIRLLPWQFWVLPKRRSCCSVPSHHVAGIQRYFLISFSYGSTACAGTEEFHAVMGGLVDHFHTCVTHTLHCCCFSGMNYLHFPVAAPLRPHSSMPCEPMGGSGWSMEPLSSKFGKNVWQVPFWGLAIVQVSKEFCSKVVNNEVIKINSSYAG